MRRSSFGRRSIRRLSILTAEDHRACGRTGLLANMRFLPMGFAMAPSMTSGSLRRLFAGALITDASFIIGHREGGRFDVNAVVWAAPAQFLGWVGGTAVGAMGATSIGETTRWGIDVLFPVFYLILVLPDLFARAASRNLRPSSSRSWPEPSPWY
jgi:predicted branched-subunit amino acid permease